MPDHVQNVGGFSFWWVFLVGFWGFFLWGVVVGFGFCFFFYHLQEWRFHNVQGRPVPLFSHPHSKKQTKVYCCVHMEHPVFQFVSTFLSPGTIEESLDLSSLNPPFRYLNTLTRSPQAISSPGQSLTLLNLSS